MASSGQQAKDGETYTPAPVYWCLAALTQIGLRIRRTAILLQPPSFRRLVG